MANTDRRIAEKFIWNSCRYELNARVVWSNTAKEPDTEIEVNSLSDEFGNQFLCVQAVGGQRNSAKH